MPIIRAISIKSITLAIFFIAFQVCIASAAVKNERINSSENEEFSIAQQLITIKQEKSTINVNLKKQETACYQKFAVNNCLKDAKNEAQTALAAVKRRESEINDRLQKTKLESDQNKKEQTIVKNPSLNNAVGSGVSENADEFKDKEKVVKAAKPVKTIKLDVEILAGKSMADKSRADAAQKRLVESNQKQAASQKKMQIRQAKNGLTDANTVKYNQKLIQAEEHKQALEKARLKKNKSKSTQLPIPNAITP